MFVRKMLFPAEDVAESAGILLYEWMEVTSDGMIPLSDGGDISGTKTKTLRIKNIQSQKIIIENFTVM